jgi:pimeloyl-ACP methyl ester carboxylesterase
MKTTYLKLLIIPILLSANLHPKLRAQICNDWKAQSTAYVLTGSSPADPTFYQWQALGNNSQGVHLCVLNADIIPVYIQKGNNFINFTSRFSPTNALLYMVHVEVNINNNGYFVIYSGSAKQDVVWFESALSFPQTGSYDLMVRVVFSDGTIRFRQYKVEVIPASQSLYKDNAGNTLRKWAGNKPGALNAIVFSEGFDAYNTNPQEMYYHAAADLIECFNDHGYDVFLLDNFFGTQDIRNNAAVFASAVQYISYLYGGELVVAGGVSMGGIISRYALAKAEQDNNPLPVHTFIAIDSPHQGAVISEPLQNFKKENEEDDEFAKHALSNTAAKQLLIYNAYDPGGGIHDAFFNELNTMNGNGYPHLTRNIGVSFSNTDPNPNSGGWYKIKYHIGPLSGTVKTFDLTAAEMQAGSWLPKDLTSMSPIIKQASYWWLQLLVPGITPLYYPTIEFERLSDPAYIPYYSALDIRNGQSLFDLCIIPENTTYHDVLPADILEEIVNEVILTNLYFQNKYIIGTWELIGGKIVSGNYISSLIPQGDVVVMPGGNLIMEASGQIMLREGFRTMHGAEASIKVSPDMYFECDGAADDASAQVFMKDAGISMDDMATSQLIINTTIASGDDLRLFPNPATNILNVDAGITNGLDASLEIYNTFSTRILSLKLKPDQINAVDISRLRQGLYLVKVITESGIRSGKFIKSD